MDKKYSVTVYWLVLVFSMKKLIYVHRWHREFKFYFRTKKEALSYSSSSVGHYVKCTIRREVK